MIIKIFLVPDYSYRVISLILVRAIFIRIPVNLDSLDLTSDFNIRGLSTIFYAYVTRTRKTYWYFCSGEFVSI